MAQIADEKKQWAKLKKGAVHVNPDAARGEARLHRYLGKGYTGALIVASAPGGVLFNRPAESGEELAVLDAAGADASVIALPANHLCWKAALPYLLVDHQVFHVAHGAAEKVVAYPGQPASFLSLGGARVAWFDGKAAVVREGAREVMRVPVVPELVAGHSLQMEGALSADGETLALCVKPGELQFHGAQARTVTGDFEMITKLAFAGDRLFALEQYGGWRLLSIEGNAVETLATGLTNADFALDDTRIAIARGNAIEVNTLEGAPLLSFTAQHVVKRCAIGFVDDRALAVRTDYGCASVYELS